MKLTGTKHKDTLVGSPAPFTDTINGRGGADVIVANGGEDRLRGGQGADTFIFNARDAVDGVPRIVDFTPGRDTIVIVADVPPYFEPPGYDDASGMVSLYPAGRDPVPIVKVGPGLDLAPPDLISV